MIFNKLYYFNDHYVLKFNNDKYVKIFYNNYIIKFKQINNINMELNEILDVYILCQFPFDLIKKSKSWYELDFLPLLNSKIIFIIEKNYLKCDIKIDNNIIAEYYIQNKSNQNKLLNIFISNINDIEPLSYLNDVEIYVYNNNFKLIIPYNKLDEIKNLSKKYNWRINFNN